MKKIFSKFPWYMIYVPVITLILIVWRLNIMSGDDSVDVLEKILNWLGLSEQIISNIVIIALALFAVVFTIAKLISSIKLLKEIEATTKMTPKTLGSNIDEAEKNICNKIDDGKLNFAKDITEIQSSTSAVQRQIEDFRQPRQDVPMQQSELIAVIHGLYTHHDQDRQEISTLRAKVQQLESRNAGLSEKNQQLKNRNAELREENQQLKSVLNQREISGRERNDWEPEI